MSASCQEQTCARGLRRLTLVEKSLSLLDVRRIETFSELGVRRREFLESLAAL